MKKLLIGTGVVVAVLLLVGFIFRGQLAMWVGGQLIKPGHTFAQQAPAAAPDYTQDVFWAALPGREDDADYVLAGATPDRQQQAAVDVFFIHPTTYFSNDAWNQPLPHPETDTITRENVLRSQASAFNHCCRIYAPFYRQATLYAFFDDSGSGDQALELAYADVRAAFNHYLQHFNQGRPFILASHSQGSRHGDLLVRDMIAGRPLQQQLVAAYLVGYSLDGNNGLEICTGPSATGCQLLWNTVPADTPELFSNTETACVNPLNWQPDDTYAGFDANLGAAGFGADTLEPGVADARCVDGLLQVSAVQSDNFSSQFLDGGNYHIYDYGFYYSNIRANASQRVDAFLQTAAP